MSDPATIARTTRMPTGATHRRRRTTRPRADPSTRGRSAVGVEDIVQPHARAGTVPCLDRAGDRVAQEQHVVAARELSCLDHGTVRKGDLRAGREVETGLDDTVVTERNSEAVLC